MTLEDILALFARTDCLIEAQSLLEQLPAELPEDWRHLAAVMAAEIADQLTRSSGFVLGISGGQGAGKTTLSNALVAAFERSGLSAASLSIDDFYLTRRERETLGTEVHPLLATRGVPGTHDVSLATSVISALKAGEAVACPSFDKALDDRRDSQPVLGPDLDVVIFEGWCVGVPPQSLEDLAEPCNDLERLEDEDGRWRGYVNDHLTRDYPALWGLIDLLLYLDVPDMAAVLRWRTEQEGAHPASRRMSPAALQRFVAHYERLTLWMGRVMPDIAQVVGFLDENHRLGRLSRR